MTAHLSRGIVLLNQQRYEEAIGELTLHLGQAADDPHVHALLSHCHEELKHLDEAQRHAEYAIHLAPDQSIGYSHLASVLIERNRLPEAERAINTALQMDPQDPNLYALKSSTLLRQKKWQASLEAANAGLMLDPEHITLLNLRSHALIMLGDRAAAAQTVEDALRRDPENASLHANQGWAALHANDPHAAATHFREALRLNPELEFARAGIIEALKARNFLYRGMLRWFLWMGRLPSQAQWGIIIGLYVVQRFLRDAGNKNPALAPYTTPILIVLISFAILTWLASPLFNLLLRFDSFGKYALDDDQRRGANLLAVTLGAGLLYLVGYFTFDAGLLWGALVFGMLSLPVSTIFVISNGWPRYLMTACVGVLLLIAVPLLLPSVVWSQLHNEKLQTALLSAAFAIYSLGIFGSQFLANALLGVRVKK